MTEDRFHGISDAELQRELARRKQVQVRQGHILNKRRARFIVDNIDLFLAAVPEHSCAVCSDEQPINPYTDHGRPRCARCRLLQIKKDGYNDKTIFRPELTDVEIPVLIDLEGEEREIQ